MAESPSNLTVPFGLNCQVLLDGSLRTEFPLLKNVLNMKADVLLGRLEEVGQCPLGKPDGIVLQPHFDAGDAILGLVEEHLTRWFAGRGYRNAAGGVK